MRYILTTVLLFTTAAIAGATVLVRADLAELSRDARAIARGRVVAVDAQWTDGRRTIETIVTLETETYLKGQLGQTVQFRIPGGSMGRFRNIVMGAPEFAVGQHVIVFLGARGPSIPFVLGLSQGVFRLMQGPDGSWLVARSAPLAVSSGGTALSAAPGGPLALADFERQVRSLAGGQP